MQRRYMICLFIFLLIEAIVYANGEPVVTDTIVIESGSTQSEQVLANQNVEQTNSNEELAKQISANSSDVDSLFDVTEEDVLPKPVFTVPSPFIVWIRSKGISVLGALLAFKSWLVNRYHYITGKNINMKAYESIN